jgi:hypothetical protein
MVRWDVMRAPMSVQLLITLGAERGVPAEVCLARTGLREEVLREPDVEVSAKQELTVVANLVSVLGDPPGLGLEAGVRYHLTTYGIWGFALISSPTWRSAIRVGLRHIDLTFAFCRFRAREEGDLMHLVLDTPDVPPPLQRFVVERDSAAVQNLQQEVFSSPIPIQEVTYTFGAPPGGTERYATVFGVTPRFDAEENTVGLPPEILDVPLPQANEHTTAMAQAQCRELLAKRLVRTGLAGQVRDHLATRLAAPPDLDRASFRGLLDEIREQLAEELLITGGLSVAEVAERLGYVEVSSFSQAFRRWKGVGPRDYRARRRGSLTRA